MFFKKTRKISYITESQIVRDLIYSHAGILQAAFGFEYQPLMQNVQCTAMMKFTA